MVRTLKQVILVLAHRGKLVEKSRIDVDVASGARTTSATQRQQFVEAVVADGFHHRQAAFDLHDGLISIPVDNDQLGHLFCFRSEEHTSELQSLMRRSYA